MPKSKFSEPPRTGNPVLDEFLLDLFNRVFGIGADVTGDLDDDNLSEEFPNLTDDEEVTGEWTFSTHPLGLSHLLIANIGTNTHPAIDSKITELDTHVADGSVHMTDAEAAVIAAAAVTAHIPLDDHTQYALLAGRAGTNDFTGEITTTGNIGAGTTSPDTIIHATAANATAVLRLERNDTTIGTDDIVGRLEVEGQDAGAAGICAKLEAIAEGNAGETGWRFSTGVAGAPAETMRLTYAGYLGIGVVDPDAKLHIQDVTGAVQRFTREDTSPTDDDIIGRIEFETQDIGSAGVAAVIQAEAEGSGGEVGLSFHTGLGGASAEIIRVSNTGRVGIGSAAPAAKAHVDQASTTAAIPVLTVDQADVSEEFIRFIGSCTDGALTGSIVEAADVLLATLTGYLKIYVQDDANVLTDKAYFVPIYTLA